MSPSTRAARAPDRRTHDPSLRASVRDGMSHAVMLGAGETYLGPFGIFLRASTLQIGLLATLPQLLSALLQWFGAVAVERLHGRRDIIVVGVLVQAAVWIPLALIPIVFGPGERAVLLLIGLAVVYHASAGFVAPIWNSLMGDLVPDDVRGRFFGRRNRLSGISSFAALTTAGLVLDLAKRLGHAAYGFLAIFALAFAARLDSARWLARYGDPVFSGPSEHGFTFWRFLVRTPHSNFARFVLFIGTINFAVAFSAPYFALYMLRDLQLSYLEFTVVSAASAVSQFLTFRYWGELSDRFGNKKILNLCTWGIATVPALWLAGASIPYLLVIQVYGGFVWAGFSLAAGNYLFDAVTPPKRARCAAYQGLVNGALVFGGSLFGGYVATRLPRALVLGDLLWAPRSTLLVIFLLSGILRLGAAAVFLRRFRELRPVEAIRHRDLVFRIVHLRPIAGATFGVLTGLFGERNGRHDDKEDDGTAGPAARGITRR